MNNTISTAWQTIFEKCKVVEAVRKNGYFDIPADTIKRVGCKEPRIMAKWDSQQAVPEVFANSQLGLISISRKSYRIAPFNLFHKIEADALDASKIQSREIPTWMLSLGEGLRERSEPGLLSSCYASGIMAEYANANKDETLPGIFGRLTTGKMAFTLGGIGDYAGKRIPIACDGIQFEIDSSYESPEAMLIIEAKNCLLDDFNLRQLYFPWRYLRDTIKKTIRPLFVMRSNEVISVCEYEFTKVDEMDSIKLVSASRYSFADTEITTQDLRDLLTAIKRKKKADDKVFPQADRMELVIDLCERLRNAPAETGDIADGLAYVHRQGQYYSQAAQFLGLVEKSAKSSHALTIEGQRIFNLPYKKRLLELAKKMLQYRVFSRCLDFALKNAALPDSDTVATWIIEDKWPMNSTTAHRRASSVIGWTRWLINLTNNN